MRVKFKDQRGARKLIKWLSREKGVQASSHFENGEYVVEVDRASFEVFLKHTKPSQVRKLQGWVDWQKKLLAEKVEVNTS